MTSAPQGTDAWQQQRLGKVTSSGVSAVISKGRNGGIPLTRNSYMDDLIAERITGRQSVSFTGPALEWGTACEAEARTFYALTRDVDVEQCGFIEHPTIPMAGCSPDGLIGDVGFCEFKCPTTATHLETIRKNSVPAKYLHQINWLAACLPERRYCDFASYDPRLEDRSKRLFVKRVLIDRIEVARLEDAVRAFLAELDILEPRVRAFYQRAAA